MERSEGLECVEFNVARGGQGRMGAMDGWIPLIPMRLVARRPATPCVRRVLAALHAAPTRRHWPRPRMPHAPDVRGWAVPRARLAAWVLGPV